ncbi:multidrug MFS transporter [Azospira sp. I13]|uniref:DHA2 family efflux MFS transporter permease subunit n=1 Tax=Azospira sp. I13 TaxID=1765050 RepID=UPI000D3FCEDC|nr:DHA2 family efflux MFS transporter permease subunit [Azospira sp. I13]GBG03880.1 multidrug MFS transporter [Azospira sp. I13]
MTDTTMPAADPRSLEALQARHGERYRWLVLTAVACGMVTAVLSATIFNVAIPALMADFHLGQDGVQWAVTGYMAAMTVAMLPTAWLIERYGFRRVFLGAIVMLAVGSLGGALSGNFALAVAMRIVQGAAAGLLQPMSTLLVLRLFPLERQGRAMGILGFGIILAPAAAPILGGFLVDLWGWRPIFAITLPGCLLSLWAGHLLLPRRDLPAVRHAFDWRGLIYLTLAILALLQTVGGLHAHGLFSWPSAAGSLLALAGLGAFIHHARRAPAPLLALGLFANQAFAMGILVAFIFGMGLYGSTYLIPVFLQSVLGYNAATAGLALLPGGIALALSTPGAGYLADRLQPHRQTALGLLLFGLSFAALAWLAVRPGPWTLLTALMAAVVLGRVGLALVLPALNLGSLRPLSSALVGQGSALLNCLRQLGGTLGISLGAVYVEWRSSHLMLPTGPRQAFAEAFCLVAAAFILALGAALAMGRTSAPARTGGK